MSIAPAPWRRSSLRLPAMLAPWLLMLAGAVSAQSDLATRVLATDQFEYSYSSETAREIVENWLDVSYLTGSFRTGLLLDSQQPSEEGGRENTIRHRFFEFASGDFQLRAGHFYGLFGRGLLFAAYEDRVIRVDTALDGLLVGTRTGRLQAAAFTGTPSAREQDVRGLDAQLDAGRGWSWGGTVLTYRPDDIVAADGSIHREWGLAGRLSKFLSFGDCYLEYGWKKGWDADPVPDDRFQNGHAFYGAVNLFAGSLALALEAKSYRRFAVLRRADGKTPLNRPPVAVREHIYTLLNRAPHNLDLDDERGAQAELTWGAPAGWTVLLNASRSERHDGTRTFEEAYAHLEKEDLGPLELRSAFDYMDSEGLRQTVIAEVGWHLDPVHVLTVTGEHQHVRVGGGPGFDLGAYDQQIVELEFAAAPRWSVAGILELNNKYPEQRAPDEEEGPFPAVQLTYGTMRGTQLSLWAGQRQAGQLCSGGVCKFEPEFEGVELMGIVRY